MKFLNKQVFAATRRQRFPDQDGGWLYDGFEAVFGCNAYTISSRAKLTTLIAKTQRLVTALHSRYPLFAFPDHIAGWREVPAPRRQSPVELSNPDDLGKLLRKHLYFRDPERYEDNYHITDGSFRWVVVFCHHGDWHFFASPDLLTMAKRA